MRALSRFFSFWYEFIVGDDASIAAGAVLALAGTAILARSHVPAWWLLPLAVVLLLGVSLTRAVRKRQD
jgi:hypothetical protein